MPDTEHVNQPAVLVTTTLYLPVLLKEMKIKEMKNTIFMHSLLPIVSSNSANPIITEVAKWFTLSISSGDTATRNPYQHPFKQVRQRMYTYYIQKPVLSTVSPSNIYRLNTLLLYYEGREHENVLREDRGKTPHNPNTCICSQTLTSIQSWGRDIMVVQATAIQTIRINSQYLTPQTHLDITFTLWLRLCAFWWVLL